MCASTRSPPTCPTAAKVDELARDYPDIDILVNNAGAIPGGSLLNVDEATWRKAWDLKVFGYVNMCRAFYALMQKRKRGVIVNVVGNAADTHDPEYICGVAGNAALAAFTQSLGSVSAKDGIRVVAINPGPVATDRLVDAHEEERRATAPAARTTGKTCSSRCRSAAAPPPKRSARPSPSSPPTTRATPAAPSSPSTPASPRARQLSERGFHATSDHRRRSEALLRGDRQRHSDRLYPRICRRLSLVGAAGPPLRRNTIAASPSMRAAIRPPMCRRIRKNIRRSARATISARCSMR